MVAFDEKTKSFKVIEYKNVREYDLLGQGSKYLKALLERKGYLVLEYYAKYDKSINIEDVDWNQTRIIFISPYYTRYDIRNFKNIPIDLYNFSRYEDGIVEINYIPKVKNAKNIEMKSSKDKHKILKRIKMIFLKLKNKIIK